MRSFLLILTLFLITSFSLSAQDKIQMKGKDTKDVKILSIKDGIIEFYFLDDPDQKERKIPLTAVENYYKAGSAYDLTKTKELEGDEREIYCQIVGISKLFSNKVTVNIDFGQEVKFFQTRDALLDANGERIVFNSMMDAMNYMSVEKGWTYVDAYVLTVGNQNVYHYVMKKRVKLVEE